MLWHIIISQDDSWINFVLWNNWWLIQTKKGWIDFETFSHKKSFFKLFLKHFQFKNQNEIKFVNQDYKIRELHD